MVVYDQQETFVALQEPFGFLFLEIPLRLPSPPWIE